jgi:hypothetical protein
MFKIKKKIEKPKPPVLYNVIEDYSEFDAPGNVTACAMTLPEDLAAHAKILAESYDVPLDRMTQLLTEGGVYVYPQVGGLLTRGLFACRIDAGGAMPKQTWVLDLMQFAEAEQLGPVARRAVDRGGDRGVLSNASRRIKNQAGQKESRPRLPDPRPCGREGRRYQVHRLPQRLVSPFQAALHHA